MNTFNDMQDSIIRMQESFEALGEKSLVNNIASTLTRITWLRRLVWVSFGIGLALTIYGIIKIITHE